MGLRTRSPGPAVVAGNKDQIGLLAENSNRTEEAVGASARGPTGATRKSGRKLSFWGFARQLATHGNFWL